MSSISARTPRYLTKSLFKEGYECPGRVYYKLRPEQYPDNRTDNEFLKALAKGGYQVGALAKLYYPAGVDLEGLDTATGIERTRELLKQEKVTVFEAALQTGPYLVRVDVLVKNGNTVELIEVKSKTYNFAEDEGFLTKKGEISSDWDSYLVDVAFQAHVAKLAYPAWSVRPLLMLADSSEKATVDGLHQLFRIQAAQNGKSIQILMPEDIRSRPLGAPLLKTKAVDREVDILTNETPYPNEQTLPGFAAYLAERIQKGEPGIRRPGALCKKCPYRPGPGFFECWEAEGKMTARDRERPTVLDIWKARAEDLMAKDVAFMDQVTEEVLRPKSPSKTERRMTRAQRQWLQVEKTVNHDPKPYVDEEGIREFLDELIYPVHCIDFETTMVPIPFHKGRRPYEQIAFQFSHHVLHQDGRVEHADQYIDTRPGVFPNFDFVRALKKALSQDNGSILRYAPHENTVLRQIRRQLLETPQPDQEELVQFIDSITYSTAEKTKVKGPRCMIDLREVILDCYYHPLMGGSNSIKQVGPALLEDSKFLQEKYGKPIYGRSGPVRSLNFDSMTWIEKDPSTGRVLDPYKRLPPVFSDFDQRIFAGEAGTLGLLFDEESIDDGGAAMTAWGRMQFTEMGSAERECVQAALLKYCELDTLAMVWVVEAWLAS